MQAAKPTVRNGYVVRKGRGYSLGELKEAGLDPHTARRSGVPVDVWRQTKYPENVERLKSIKTDPHKDRPAKKEKKAAKKG